MQWLSSFWRGRALTLAGLVACGVCGLGASWAEAQIETTRERPRIRVIETKDNAETAKGATDPAAANGAAPVISGAAPAPAGLAGAAYSERALALQQLDSAILEAQARLETHEARLARYAEMAATTPAFSYYPSWTLPQPAVYSPVRVAPQVDRILPSQTPFTHVAELVQRRRDEAALELQSLQQQREALLRQAPAVVAAPAALTGSAREERLAEIEAEIELMTFRRDTLARRVEQFEQTKRLVYSAPLSDQWDKLQLDLYSAELRLRDLAAARDSLLGNAPRAAAAASSPALERRIRVVPGVKAPSRPRAAAADAP